MIHEMYAEGAPGLKLWLCGDCGKVAYYRSGAKPAHECEAKP